jgi:hypothetical protein
MSGKVSKCIMVNVGIEINTPAMDKKQKKIKIGRKKCPFYQPIRRQHSQKNC